MTHWICQRILLWCDQVTIKGDIQYAWPYFIVLLGLKANIATSSEIPMLLFMQLLTNSLDTSLNCISDVYEFPVTKHNKREEEKMLQVLIQAYNKAIKAGLFKSYMMESRNYFVLFFVLICRLVSLMIWCYSGLFLKIILRLQPGSHKAHSKKIFLYS